MKTLSILFVAVFFSLPFLTQAQVEGKWTSELLGENGEMLTFIIDFKKDGSYEVDFGKDGSYEVKGNYVVTGNTLTFKDDSEPCEGKPGTWAYVIKGTTLSLTAKDEPCPARKGTGRMVMNKA